MILLHNEPNYYIMNFYYNEIIKLRAIITHIDNYNALMGRGLFFFYYDLYIGGARVTNSKAGRIRGWTGEEGGGL